MLAFPEPLPALQHTPGLDHIVVAGLEPVAFEQIEQHESITGRHCIDGQRLALEVLVCLDLREDAKAEQTVVTSHEDEKIGLYGQGGFALAFHVSNDIVEGSETDIELTFDQTRACPQLSRMIAATNWTAARKFRASLS